MANMSTSITNMSNDPFVIVFQMTLLFALLLSFYIFVKTIFWGDITKKKIFSNWQFPMILAIYLDLIYHKHSN